MKSTKSILTTLIFFFLLGGGSVSFAQDIHFSQFWLNPLQQNPAMAGIDHGLEASINYKDQWRSVSSPYKTLNVSADARLNKRRIRQGFLALGFSVLNDKAGDGQMGALQADFSFASHLFLDDHNTLGAGLMGGFGQRSVNYSNLQWASQFDGNGFNSALPGGEYGASNSYTFMDLGAGLAWAYHGSSQGVAGFDHSNATAGIAIFHPQQPLYGFDHGSAKLDPRIVAHFNARFDLKNRDLAIIPAAMYYKQGVMQELLLGASLRFSIRKESHVNGYVSGSAFSLGLHYRSDDAVIATMLLELGQLGFGFAYDINVSQLKTASSARGGLELSIYFHKAESPRYSPRN
jgi:type IX secretion system PorP/SprF family membrane protein